MWLPEGLENTPFIFDFIMKSISRFLISNQLHNEAPIVIVDQKRRNMNSDF